MIVIKGGKIKNIFSVNDLIYILAFFGTIWISVIFHELYHWFFSNNSQAICLNLKGMYVISQNKTGEVIPTIIGGIVAVILITIILNKIMERRK